MDRPLIGLTSLAVGADQLFAAEVLAAGGSLHAVIPSTGYELTFEGKERASYQNLLEKSSTRTLLEYPTPSEEAYDAAGKYITEHCDLLIAIWDGAPARGLGGTADAVAYAQEIGCDVHILWPPGLKRN
ncbi:hypothetical protein [Rhodococcus wratislaviensis]|uniref:hypothetical protein n=1 Tax=Rhodococcus wratislaviensis TaxID=44752 RepID=UPI001CEDAFF7|nr:hypothetical protein [Rhodococcus wratislaviensis]